MPTNYTPSQVYDKYVALQKQLATNITNKGVTASQTELYDNLIDKVAQIENLNGEERTLENFTNVLSEPKSIVQLKYPIDNIIVPPYVGLTTTTSGITATVNKDNSVTFNGTATANANFNFKNIATLDIGTYAFNVQVPTGCSYTLGKIKNVGTDISSGNITVTSVTSDSYWLFNIPSGTVLDNVTVRQPILYKVPAPKTLNAKLGSKNLIPYPYPVQGSTINGITYTNNTDGSVTAVGTATAASIYAPYTATANFELEPGTYTFSDDLTPTSSLTYWSEVRGYKDDTIFVHSYDTNRTFTITEKTKLRMNLRVLKEQTVNITFKPQIVKGTADTSFSPYVSDLTTVNVTRCGKNLIPYPYADTTKTLNGITFTVNSDGSVTVSGTATAQAYFKLQQSFSLKKGQYFFSGCPTGGSGATYSLYLSTSDYVFYKADIGNGISINSEDDKTVLIDINIAKDTTVENLVFKPQLELGTSATPYEPYQGQPYTPTAFGEVTGITNLYPTTTLLTDNAGVIFEQITGGVYKEILPSTDKNGITKVYQPSVDSSIDSNITSDNIKQGVSILGVTGDYICNYTYDETTKELVLIL